MTCVYAVEPTCPAEKPIDEILAEIYKQNPKRAARNRNPLPDNICIFGWCRGTGKTPPIVEKPPSVEHGDPTKDVATDSAADKCRAAFERTLHAAHNVDVGDYNFEEKNYRGALSRYQEALDDKPRDTAIHVRLGRTYEKLNEVPKAIEQYEAATKLETPEQWTKEAREALARLKAGSGG